MARALALVVVALVAACASAQLSGGALVYRSWEYQGASTASWDISPLWVGGGMVVFGSEANYIAAVNATTGAFLWQANSTSDILWIGVKGMNIIAYTQNEVFAVTMSGTPVWSVSANSSYFSSIALPVWPNDAWFFLFGSSSSVYYVEAATGFLSKVYDSGTSPAAPAVMLWNPFRVILPGYSYICSFNASGYEWFRKSFSFSMNPATPAAWMDWIFFASSGGSIWAYNSTTGDYKWSSSLPSGTISGWGLVAFVNSSGLPNLAAVSGSYISKWCAATGMRLASSQSSQGYTLTVGTYDAMNMTFYVYDSYASYYRFDISTWMWTWARTSSFATSYGGMKFFNNDTVVVAQYSSSTAVSGVTIFGLDAWTGASKIQYSVGVYGYPRSFAWDPVSFGGSLVVGTSDNRVFSLLANVALTSGAASFRFTSPVITPAFVWMNTMYFATASAATAVGYNSSVLWIYNLTGDSFLGVRPTIANNRVYLATILNKVVILDAYSGVLITTVDTSAPTKGSGSGAGTCTTVGSYISGFQPDGTDVFFAGFSYCVYKLDSTNTLWAAKGGSYSFRMVPTTSSQFVYAGDNNQALFAFAKLTMTQLWTKATTTAGTLNGPLEAGGDLYFGDNYGSLYCYGTVAGTKWWEANLGAYTVIPFAFYGYIYASNSVGNLSSFEQGYFAITGTNGYKKKFSTQANSTYSLGVPAISPDGVMVFANTDGVFAIRYNGTALWSNKMYTGCSMPSISMGVAFAVCNMRLTLYDLYRGNAWLQGSYGTTFYSAANATAFVTTGNQVNLLTYGAQNAPYSPSQLPAPLPPRNDLGNLVEKNLVWIAGVVVGVVVLIVLILVIKKVTGGKKDTDYVAMQNPVNTGGV